MNRQSDAVSARRNVVSRQFYAYFIGFTVHQKSDAVTDVMVLDHESVDYQPLEPTKNYSVSLGVFYSSKGFYGILKDCKVLKVDAKTTRDALETFMTRRLRGNWATHTESHKEESPS